MKVKELIVLLSEVEEEYLEQNVGIEITINGISVYIPITKIGFTGQLHAELKSN